MDAISIITFSVVKLASALGISEPDVRAIMTDARTATPIVQRRIAADYPEWRLTKGTGGSDILRDAQDKRWQVKSITDRVNLTPSKHIGYGRNVVADEVVHNWRGMGGYLLIDIQKFPAVTVYRVPIDRVERWARDGQLTEKASIKRDALMKLLAKLDT